MGEYLDAAKPSAVRVCLQATRWQVLTMIPCFAVILGGHIFGAYAAYYNLDGSFPHPVAFGLAVSVQCVFFLFLGAYYFLATERERIWILDNAIFQRGVCFTRRIEFKDVLALNWRRHTFRLIVEGPQTRISIWLNNYPFAQQQQVIEHFRTAIPKHRHKNYRKFRKRYEEFHCIPRDMTVQEARSSVILCISLLSLTSAGFVAVWFGGAEGPSLEIAVMCAIAGVSYLWRYSLFKARVAFQREKGLEVSRHAC